MYINDHQPQNRGATSVWIVEQHPLAAAYLLQLLREDKSISARLIADIQPAKAGLGAHPYFILDNLGLDIPMTEYVRRLSARPDEDARYLVLDRRPIVDRTCHLMSLGIHGFLAHDQVHDSLVSAVQCIRNGGMWFDSSSLKRYALIKKSTGHKVRTSPSDEHLTLREDEILHLTRERLSNKEIAAILDIEISTVKFHLSHLFSKLQVAGRSDLWKSGENTEAHASRLAPNFDAAADIPSLGTRLLTKTVK